MPSSPRQFFRPALAILAALLLLPGGPDARAQAGLMDVDPLVRAAAIRDLPDDPKTVEVKVIQQVIGMLDDSTRVALPQTPGGLAVSSSPAREAGRHLTALGPAIMQQLLGALVTERPSIRWRVAQILGEIGDPAAVNPLLDAMSQDQDKLVRMTAAEALVKIGANATIPLLDLLRTGNEDQVEQAIWVLSESQDERALLPLLEMAIHGTGANAQRAATALLKIGPRVVPQLLSLIETPANEVVVRARAIRIAAQITHPQVLNTLCYMVLAGDLDALREEALLALAQSRGAPAVIDTLLNVLYDVDRRFARRVPEVMGLFDGRAAAILEGYLENPSPRLQACAMEGLHRIGAASVPTFVHLLESPVYSFEIRRQAASHFKRLGFPGATFDTRVNAMTLVGDWAGLSLLGPQLEPHFLRMLDNPEPTLREAGILLLSDLRSSQHTGRYLDLLGDPDSRVRAEALRALTKLDRLSFPEMARQLDRRLDTNLQAIGDILIKGGYRPRTDYDRLRLHAAVENWDNVSALGESAVALLLEKMRGEDVAVATWAAWTLARFADRTSLEKFTLRQLDADMSELLYKTGESDLLALYRVMGQSTERKAAPFLLVPLLMRDEQRRDLAAAALGVQGTAALRLLELCLESGQPLLRQRALLALRRCGAIAPSVLTRHMADPVIGNDVLAVLDGLNYRPSGADAEEAYFLATREYGLLARLGQRALKPLVKAAADRDNPDRVRAVRALGEIPDESVYDSLMLLHGDDDAAVRTAVEDTFRALGPPAQPYLLKAATRGGLVNARNAAQLLAALDYTPVSEEEEIWLAAARNDWPFLQLRKERALAVLRASLLDENARRRALAANSVTSIREYEVMAVRTAAERLSPDLLASLRDENPESRALAAYLCGRFAAGNTNIVAHLLPLLSDNTPVLWVGEDQLGLRLRPTPGIHAAIALAKIGPEAVPTLIRHYEQASAETRFNASLALCSIPHPLAAAHQMAALQSPRYELRYKAVESLGLARRPEAVPALINAALAPDSNLSHPVLAAVRNIGPSAVPELRRELDNAASGNRRRFLLELLGQVQTPEVIPLLVQHLGDEDVRVRRAAYQSLARIPDPAAVAAVVDALGDEYWTIRESALMMLAEMGQRAVPRLLDQLRADSTPKSQYIQRALQQITGEGFGSDVGAWRRWGGLPEKIP